MENKVVVTGEGYKAIINLDKCITLYFDQDNAQVHVTYIVPNSDKSHSLCYNKVKEVTYK